MVLKNINSKQLLSVLDDVYAEPNIIKFKPDSERRIRENANNIPMNIETVDIPEIKQAIFDMDVKEETPIRVVESNEKFDLYFMDGEIELIGDKPIKLPGKMINVVYSKHDRYVEEDISIEQPIEVEEPEISNTEEPKEDFKFLEPQFEKIHEIKGIEDTFMIPKEEDSVTLPEISTEKEYFTFEVPEEAEFQKEQTDNTIDYSQDMYDNLSSLSQTVTNFTDLINSEVQANNILSSAKEELSNSMATLGEIEKEEQTQILKNYELEKKVIEEVNRQKDTLKKQTTAAKTRLFGINNDVASTNVKLESVQNKINATLSNVDELKTRNSELLSIINAISNSYGINSDDEEKPYTRVA